MQGLALVDYDNLCPDARSEPEVEICTADLLDLLAGASRAVFPGLSELDVRLYGGWIDEHGVHSESARWLLPLLPALRGRRQGLIVRPTLAITMLQFPGVELRGTVRLQGTKRRRQKMVDGMLGCDAVFAATLGQSPVGIVSDDDDLLPAPLSAHAADRADAVLMRRRAPGQGLNDRSAKEYGLRIQCLERKPS